MFELIKNYITKMTKEDLDLFLKKENITLSDKELDYTYNFIQKNYEALYSNPNIDLSRFKSMYTTDNYNKLIAMINKYKIKYASFLN